MGAGTVVITGCTRGLGRAMVGEFLRAGWRVAGCGRDAEQLAALERANGCSSRCRGSSLCGDLEPSKESRNKMDRMSLSTAEAAIARLVGRVFPVMCLQSRQGVGR